jgi:hypothetical protein
VALRPRQADDSLFQRTFYGEMLMEFAGYGLVAITALIAILWMLRMVSRAKRKDAK